MMYDPPPPISEFHWLLQTYHYRLWKWRWFGMRPIQGSSLTVGILVCVVNIRINGRVPVARLLKSPGEARSRVLFPRWSRWLVALSMEEISLSSRVQIPGISDHNDKGHGFDHGQVICISSFLAPDESFYPIENTYIIYFFFIRHHFETDNSLHGKKLLKMIRSQTLPSHLLVIPYAVANILFGVFPIQELIITPSCPLNKV